MGHTDNTHRTFDLKVNLHCENCVEQVEKIVLKIEGVDSVDIDKDLELGKATVSGNVNPQTVIKKLKDKGKVAKLLGKEEEERPPKMMQHNPVRIDKRKVAPQPPGVDSVDIDKDLELRKATVSGNVNPQTVIKKPKDKRKHAKLLGKKEEEEERPPKMKHQEMQINPVRIDQRKVAPQPPGLISKSVGKRTKRAIHDCNPKHDHELELKSYNKPFKCNKCREDGFTSGYRCKHCIYDLHKGCLNPKPKIIHDLFPGSIFEFRQKPGKICDACGMKIHGHSYSCKEDNLDLHPACSKLPGKLGISGTDFVLCKKVKYKCFWCKKVKPSWLAETKVVGLCYVSERDEFSCHVHCLSLVMQEAWKRGRGDLDRNNDDDAISKALEKSDLKLVATVKGSGGKGGGLFLEVVTIFLNTIISILFGDPTGLIVSALTGLVKELLTLESF